MDSRILGAKRQGVFQRKGWAQAGQYLLGGGLGFRFHGLVGGDFFRQRQGGGMRDFCQFAQNRMFFVGPLRQRQGLAQLRRGFGAGALLVFGNGFDPCAQGERAHGGIGVGFGDGFHFRRWGAALGACQSPDRGLARFGVLVLKALAQNRLRLFASDAPQRAQQRAARFDVGGLQSRFQRFRRLIGRIALPSGGGDGALQSASIGGGLGGQQQSRRLGNIVGPDQAFQRGDRRLAGFVRFALCKPEDCRQGAGGAALRENFQQQRLDFRVFRAVQGVEQSPRRLLAGQRDKALPRRRRRVAAAQRSGDQNRKLLGSA
ncbi:MAG: hypothetical protein BWZ10_02645 [candidate division BRC1 bacterium ADurb.BinA364]|nr:MAG: hypothetical protein BWZ10_02645 [candidate division BRC1 bacterium ADurb.BinA364]